MRLFKNFIVAQLIIKKNVKLEIDVINNAFILLTCLLLETVSSELQLTGMQQDQSLQMVHKLMNSVNEFWKCYQQQFVKCSTLYMKLHIEIDKIEVSITVDEPTSKRIYF